MDAHVTGDTKRWLGALPFRIDIRPFGGHLAGPCLTLIHGDPVLNTVYWTEDRSDRFCMQMAESVTAKSGDVIAFGHTHKPWHRIVEGIHFVNTGSVGRPKDGDWRAGYTVLSFEGENVTVAHVRTEYDVDRAVRDILSSELPADFAEHLRIGGTPYVASGDQT